MDRKQLIILCILGQSAITLLIVSNYFFSFLYPKPLINVNSISCYVFLFLSIFLTVICLNFVFKLQGSIEKDVELKEMEKFLAYNKEIITFLRSQRHDFLNHLMVVNGLISLNKTAKAREYVNEITNVIQDTGKVIAIKNPALSSLLLIKLNQLETMGVKVLLNVQSSLDGLTVSANELVRIAGNILDNAIYELNHSTTAEKFFKLEIVETAGDFFLTFTNSGSVIGPEIINKIFEPGFTTKGDQGTGMGLYNVTQLVKKNHGEISLESTVADGTSFKLKFPRPAQSSAKDHGQSPPIMP